MSTSSSELGAEVCVAYRRKPQASPDCMEGKSAQQCGAGRARQGNLRLVHRHWTGRVEEEDVEIAFRPVCSRQEYHLSTR